MTNDFKNIENWQGCPVRFGMGIFGDKWTLLVIRDLMFKGKSYYGQFQDSEEGISTNILADRLQKLERNGIIDKARDAENGARYIYRLTPKGLDMMPMMLAMIDWAERYDGQTEVPPAFIKELRRDPAGLAARLRAELEAGT